MDSLPQEAIDSITRFVEHNDERQRAIPVGGTVSELPSYTIIFRRWQCPIERLALKNIRVVSQEQEKFMSICGGYREAYIAEIISRSRIRSIWRVQRFRGPETQQPSVDGCCRRVLQDTKVMGDPPQCSRSKTFGQDHGSCIFRHGQVLERFRYRAKCVMGS